MKKPFLITYDTLSGVKTTIVHADYEDTAEDIATEQLNLQVLDVQEIKGEQDSD